MMKRKISFALIMMLTLGLCLVKPISVLADSSTQTVSILTVDKDGKWEISGAKYSLEKKIGNAYVTVKGMDNFLVSDEGLKLGELKSGEYRLTETVSPAGYLSLSNPVVFEVTSSGVSFSENYGSKVSLTENNGSYQIVIYNEIGSVLRLPSTGGNGTIAYTIGGLTLMLLGASAIIYAYKKERIYGK